MQIPFRIRLRIAVQRWMGRMAFPVLGPLMILLLRLWGGYRIKNLSAVRGKVAALMGKGSGPLMICANHLTLIDSLLIQWAVFPIWTYLADFDRFAWNMPERRTLEKMSLWMRVVAFFGQCIPVVRGADPEATRVTLATFGHLLQSGGTVMVFPEGTRSRSGVIDTTQFAYGPGRLVQAGGGVRVLCVYLRGEHQATYSDWPRHGDRFSVDADLITPRSPHEGLRGARDIATQIINRLGCMERAYFASEKLDGERPCIADVAYRGSGESPPFPQANLLTK